MDVTTSPMSDLRGSITLGTFYTSNSTSLPINYLRILSVDRAGERSSGWCQRHFPSVVMQPVSMKPKVKREMSHGDLGELGCDGRYARETEQKRVKGQRSCAECTRLKIKCNKQIPCQSCRVSRFSIPWHSYHNNNFRSFTYFHSEGVAKHYVPMEASSQAKELGPSLRRRNTSSVSWPKCANEFTS